MTRRANTTAAPAWRWAARVGAIGGAAVVTGTFLLGVHGCRTDQATQKDFTQQDVTEVLALLEGADPSTYRIVLPQFRGTEAIGTRTYGALPLVTVQRVASSKNIAFEPGGNLQAIFKSNGGGAGSHTESQTPGNDLGRRIEAIIRNIDQNAFVWVR